MDQTLKDGIERSIAVMSDDFLVSIKFAICTMKTGKDIDGILGNDVLTSLSTVWKAKDDRGIIEAKDLIASLIEERLGFPVVVEATFSTRKDVPLSVIVSAP